MTQRRYKSQATKVCDIVYDSRIFLSFLTIKLRTASISQRSNDKFLFGLEPRLRLAKSCSHLLAKSTDNHQCKCEKQTKIDQKKSIVDEWIKKIMRIKKQIRVNERSESRTNGFNLRRSVAKTKCNCHQKTNSIRYIFWMK